MVAHFILRDSLTAIPWIVSSYCRLWIIQNPIDTYL